MLGDRQQFDVGEAACDNVFREFARQFSIAQPGPPGTEMHLVGAHRFEHRVGGGAFAIQSASCQVYRETCATRCLRWDFGGECERIGRSTH